MSGVQFPVCKCGHPRDWHPDDLQERCSDRFCGCDEYIPKTLQLDDPRPAIIADSSPVALTSLDDDQGDDDQEALVARGKRSHSKRTVALASKIEALLSELADKLESESASAQVRAEIARHEAKLAELKARLASGAAASGITPSKRPGPRRGEYPCSADGCEYVSPTTQGRAAHFRFNHKEAS